MRLIFALIGSALSLGCFKNECGDGAPEPLRSGKYAVGEIAAATSSITPSYANGAPKKLELDRTTGIVRVSYTLDGRSVVETWRMGPVRR